MAPTDEIKARLNELGVEYDTYDLPNGERGVSWIDGSGVEWEAVQRGENFEIHALQLVTPEQAIAATVGVEKWEPSKEWKAWHNSLKHDNPTSIREAIENILYEAIDFGGDMGPNGNVWSGVDEGAVLTENCIDGWVESVESIAATVGRSCASCPEMDNPDSYISHLQSALKWHDEHVPRPTNPRNTCVVLKGQNPPEEVLFVHDEGGVTHYLPEGVGTCHAVLDQGYYKGINGVCEGLYCSKCKEPLSLRFKHCPWCGRKIKED